MDIEQALLEQVRSLTPEQQQEVLDFAAFLRQKAPAQPRSAYPDYIKGFHIGWQMILMPHFQMNFG